MDPKRPLALLALLISITLVVALVALASTFKSSLKDRAKRDSIVTFVQKAPHRLGIEDVFIAVKTSQKFHQSRLKLLLTTWVRLAPSQVWFFSDSNDVKDDIWVRQLVNTKCSSSHNRSALNCKMAAELSHFLRQSGQRWFCHFDDDNYVNIPRLVEVLNEFDFRSEWYLGKTSVKDPLRVMDRFDMDKTSKRPISFWFATGGAGFCLSRPLVIKMSQYLEGNRFEEIGESIRLPDDVTVGFIVEHKLGVPLTPIKLFHSHLEPLKLIPKHQLHQQISFSYSETGNHQGLNTVEVSGADLRDDPTRFVSLHCFLFPGSIPECSRL